MSTNWVRLGTPSAKKPFRHIDQGFVPLVLSCERESNHKRCPRTLAVKLSSGPTASLAHCPSTQAATYQKHGPCSSCFGPNLCTSWLLDSVM